MRARLGIVALALLLSACGSGSETASSDVPDATESTTAAVAASFAAPVDLGNGVSITISEPASFTPGDFASNYLPGQTADLFTVDITNSGADALDLSTITLSAMSGANVCMDVLDGDNGINGAPTDPVAPGATSSFKYGIACDAKAGDDLAITVAVGETNIALKGALA